MCTWMCELFAVARASNASDDSMESPRQHRLQMQKESAVRLASAALPAVDENGEVTVPSSISQEHRELFARAQRWVTMSDADIEVRCQLLPSLRLLVLLRTIAWLASRDSCALNVRQLNGACSGDEKRGFKPKTRKEQREAKLCSRRKSRCSRPSFEVVWSAVCCVHKHVDIQA